MNMYTYTIEVGDVIRLSRSNKTGKFVSYEETGKIILIKNQDNLKAGFARVTKVLTVKDKYTLVCAENVVYDVYTEEGGISYTELCTVLENLGFVKEYQTAIDSDNVFDVWARLETGELVTLETWNKHGCRGFNTINLYIPTGNNTIFRVHRDTGISHGNYYVCCFNALHCKMDFPLHYLLSLSSQSRDWHGESPALWHYGDGDDLDFPSILSRIFEFKDNLNSLFNMDIKSTIAKHNNMR